MKLWATNKAVTKAIKIPPPLPPSFEMHLRRTTRLTWSWYSQQQQPPQKICIKMHGVWLETCVAAPFFRFPSFFTIVRVPSVISVVAKDVYCCNAWYSNAHTSFSLGRILSALSFHLDLDSWKMRWSERQEVWKSTAVILAALLVC